MDSLMPDAYWLYELHDRRPECRAAIKRLLRMKIAVSHRTGHMPEFPDPQVRQAILHSARHGLMANVTIACSRCSAAAKLIDWDTLGTMGIDDHRQCIMQAAMEHSLPLYGYLLQCPGTTLTRQSAPTGGRQP